MKTLIDTFVNAVFLYDDKMVLTYDFHESTETITFGELQVVLPNGSRGSDMRSGFRARNVPDREIGRFSLIKAGSELIWVHRSAACRGKLIKSEQRRKSALIADRGTRWRSEAVPRAALTLSRPAFSSVPTPAQTLPQARGCRTAQTARIGRQARPPSGSRSCPSASAHKAKAARTPLS